MGIDHAAATLQSELTSLETRVASFLSFFNAMPESASAAMHGTLTQMHALCCELSSIPSHHWKSAQVKNVLKPAIELQSRSRFIKRLQEWPRGYPGDFETVELLVSGSPVPSSNSAAEWINWYALNTAIAQQHRNKIAWQHRLMSIAGGQRILSAGCGGGADFAIGLERFQNTHVALLDIDRDALELAEKRLSPHAKVYPICGDVRRGVRKAQQHGPFDLVVCGGLFDYLDDRTISFLLLELSRRALPLGGMIAFTNIAELNPFQCWMEAIADWNLIHRSEEDIFRIAETAGCDRSKIAIERDGTGLTHLVTICIDTLSR